MCATSVVGEWLKLAATDYDFKVNMDTSGAHFRGRILPQRVDSFMLRQRLKLSRGLCLLSVWFMSDVHAVP